MVLLFFLLYVGAFANFQGHLIRNLEYTQQRHKFTHTRTKLMSIVEIGNGVPTCDKSDAGLFGLPVRVPNPPMGSLHF